MPRLPHRVAALAALAVALVLPGCSRTSEATGPTADALPTTTQTPPTTAPPTTTPPPTPEDEVTQAYLEAFVAYFQAGVDPEVPATSLASHFTGAALDAVRENIDSLAARRLASRFPGGLPTVRVRSVNIVDSSTAQLEACLVDEGHKVDVDSGQRTDEPPSSRLTEAQLVRNDAIWRVSQHRTVEEWPNAVGCDQ